MFYKTVGKYAATAIVATAFGAMPAVAETLSFAHFVPPQHTITSSTIEPLQAAIAKMSPDLEIQVYPGGELGAGPLEQYVRAVQGVADMVWGLQGYTSSQFPKTMLSELPGVKTDGQNGYDILWDAYESGQISGEFPATVPLALYLSEPNVFIMKDHDVRTPADVAGLKIRVSGSAAARVIEALGATAVQMPANEIYNSLQTGLIDGVVTGASAIGDFKLDEVANSYTTGVSLGQISFYVVMNKARYDGLSDKHRAAIDSIAGRALSKSAEDGWNARAEQVLDTIQSTGDNTVIELTADEAAAFSAITDPLADVIAAEIGAEDVLATMRGN
ncbi:TRAP transporter substrate-binding protein [Puniceibacterium sp. IMCC21224]|uniref:TRAP transporter substrate-binding protein n=1 Tax=Puniceibacterium sp. IMCC21224 TaxID=1618204 RepID=UPI00064D9309|nr:TRAP transporter substrate-binding protein [Puniceibacterium sp. IMCC21224]KMK66165.1 TRAP-type C4-dicarboxylate transport system, periplasmic component [Puniceibacterium sp. IMCC21224]